MTPSIVRGNALALLALGVPLATIAGACTFDGLDGYTNGADGSTLDAHADVPSSDDVAVDQTAADAPLGDAPVDAPPPPPCNLSAPFANAGPVAALDTVKLEAQAALSPDQLTVYFESDRLNAGSNVFTASRTTVASSFGSVSPIASLNYATADTWNATLTADGLTAYLVTNEGGSDHMYVAKRASSLAAFGGPLLMPVPIVSGEQPFVRPDGLVLYYSQSSGNGTIARALLGTTPTVTTVAVSVAQRSVAIPVINPTETLLYFAAFIPNNGDSFDIWMSSRATANDAWSAPVAVSELNTSGLDAPSWISPDGCTLYYTHAAIAGDWNIWSARRP